jgi:hypothetical protein
MRLSALWNFRLSFGNANAASMATRNLNHF